MCFHYDPIVRFRHCGIFAKRCRDINCVLSSAPTAGDSNRRPGLVALENCRALINQINAGLFVEEPFVNVSWAAELQLYLEFAASALKKAAPRP
jgi:hypothetical protein